MPPVAKPVPAIASIKAEPVPQTAKGDDGKEFLYATKVSPHNGMLVLPAVKKKEEGRKSIDDTLSIGMLFVLMIHCSQVCCQHLHLYQASSEHVASLLVLHGSARMCLNIMF